MYVCVYIHGCMTGMLMYTYKVHVCLYIHTHIHKKAKKKKKKKMKENIFRSQRFSLTINSKKTFTDKNPGNKKDHTNIKTIFKLATKNTLMIINLLTCRVQIYDTMKFSVPNSSSFVDQLILNMYTFVHTDNRHIYKYIYIYIYIYIYT